MHKFSKWAAFFATVLVLLVLLFLYSGSKPSLRLPTGSGRAVVALGDSHGVILASDGSLWVWGEQLDGWPSLGMGKVECQPRLQRLGTDTNWVDVAATQRVLDCAEIDGVSLGRRPLGIASIIVSGLQVTEKSLHEILGLAVACGG